MVDSLWTCILHSDIDDCACLPKINYVYHRNIGNVSRNVLPTNIQFD